MQVNSDSTWPDIQIVLLAVHVAIDAGLVYRNVLNMKYSYWKDNFKALTLKEGYTCLPILHHPLSRGSIRLKSGRCMTIMIIWSHHSNYEVRMVKKG